MKLFMTVRWGFGRQVVCCRKWLHCIGGERARPLCMLYTLASAYPRLLLISALVLSTLAMQCRSKGTRVQEMVTWWPSTGLQVSCWYFSTFMRLDIRYYDCIRVTSAKTCTKKTVYCQFCTQICSRHCLQCIAMLANI